MNSERIYLDHAATTPLRAQVARAMQEAFPDCLFNPSSLHAEGRRARAVLDAARDRIAATLGARRTEIVFTAGGTESDNLALLGVARAMPAPVHVVVSAVEHHAVMSALDRLREEGVQTSLVPVDSNGRVDPVQFERALRPHTALASIMYANNEVGSVQPIAELAGIARRRGVLFHSDAVAAPTWLPLDVRELGVDLLSLAAHKFYGPQGIGVLYVRRGVPLAPASYGGGQESGRRSGTENVAGAVGLARALELAVLERPEQAARVAGLRDRLEAGIRSRIAGVRVNGAGTPRLASLLNVSFAGVDAGALLVALDLAGVAVSAGSACTSGTLEPSHVLAAMASGRGHRAGGIRFSLGTATRTGEIDRVVELLPELVARLRNPPEGSLAAGMDGLGTKRARLGAEA